MKRVLIDTDAGVDDAMAVALAVASPELKIEAITVVSGNVDVDKSVRNMLLVLETLDVKTPPPVARGEAVPLSRPLLTAANVHGADGVGGITQMILPDGSRKYPDPSLSIDPRPATQVIIDLARYYGAELTLVTIGPLTNIARAIERDREAMRMLGEIVIMGGAFRERGNTSRAAEFNIYVDPEAAQKTLDLGVPITIIPLDVTKQVRLMRSVVEKRLADKPSKALEFVRDVSSFYMDFHHRRDGFDGCFMHDPLTVGVAIDPTFVRTVAAKVSIETTDDLTRGVTRAELHPDRIQSTANAKVAVEVDADRFLSFFFDRLTGL